MYAKSAEEWMKHLDFILLDIIIVELSLFIVVGLRLLIRRESLGYLEVYRQIAVILFLMQFLFSSILPDLHRDILARGPFFELRMSIHNMGILVMAVILIMYVIHRSGMISRMILLELLIVGCIMMWGERLLWKYILRRRKNHKDVLPQMVLITEKAYYADIVAKLCDRTNQFRYQVKAVFVTDFDPGTDYSDLLPAEIAEEDRARCAVLGEPSYLYDYLVSHVVDEAMICLNDIEQIYRMANQLYSSGMVVHINMRHYQQVLPNPQIENYNGMMVMTCMHNQINPVELAMKRGLDILGGLCGLLITGVLAVILGPIIKIQSPGPIFYTQERVGTMGRRFRLYKFRSMYPDADARKAALMAENKMDGFMFKMDNDPRIFPVGRFMRKYSLDEFPQFLNILKGDMSLVGTRPPTIDEWEQYELHHRARLAFKPGLTGMWQVSGRSNITDFEEVVRLDMEYIHSWSMALDIKILLKTVLTVFRGEGSV